MTPPRRMPQKMRALQGAVIEYIASHPRSTILEIEQHLTAGAGKHVRVGGLLDRMRLDNLVVRERHTFPGTARARDVYLSPELHAAETVGRPKK